ncbi:MULTISPECIES: type IV pilin protein [Acinetobacter]|jgi:type IV pilus assembly protein PilE|uniref:type IV pilin protein n=1 Tax=Acinetobacter TaxID=469 RepID=UPI0015D3E4FF|nr:MULTISPECIES: type IV pilin protein [Acinetobacter]MCO8060909.1 type IV pilin protein [Acinetobacter lwoffii]
MKNIKGFTLIELIIVVAVLGVLAAIAYPSYQSYVKRTNRAEIQSTMMEIAQRLQSYKLSNGDYGVNNSTSSYAMNPLINPAIYGQTVAPRNGPALYDLTITASPNSSWTMTATPKINGQMKNTGNLTLDSSGKQCWEKTSGACEPWDGR